MASSPLLDFDAVDLSRTVVPIESVREHCQQRNRFEMLHGILHLDLESGLIVGYRDIHADDWWAEDHVPGRPIFPGALQIEGAAQLCTYAFMRRSTERAGQFVGFAGLNDTRFRGIVEPPSRLIWAARQVKIRSSIFVYQAQGYVDRRMVFETEIMGMVF